MSKHFVYSVVVERLAQLQPAPQIVPGTDIVSGKEVRAAETAQQHIFRAPAAYAVQCLQVLDRRFVVELRQLLEVELPPFSSRLSQGSSSTMPSGN